MEAAESDAEAAQFPLCDTPLNDDVTGEERREDVAVLTSEGGACGPKTLKAKRALYQVRSSLPRFGQLCRWRQGAVLILGVFLTVVALTLVVVGAVKARQHSSITLLHIKHPVDLKAVVFLGDENFTFAQLMGLNNMALDKPAFQSSLYTKDSTETTVQHNAAMAVDGNLSSCSNTGLVRKPAWRVDLLRSRPVKSIRIQGTSSNRLHHLSVYVTNSNDMPRGTEICGMSEANPATLDVRIACTSQQTGQYVVIVVNTSDDTFESLNLCEVMVYQ